MKFIKKPIPVEATQWNPPNENGLPKLSINCQDHPAVRPTSYSEISTLCGTSGCSREEPFWQWSVMGVIDTLEGRHCVIPGDWIVTGIDGESWPVKDHIFRKTYEPFDKN